MGESTCPVTNEASLSHKNSAQRGRLIGGSRAAERRRVDDGAKIVLGKHGVHRRVDESRADAVDADLIDAELLCQRARQRDHRALRRGIGAFRRAADLPPHRRKKDDVSAAAVDHAAERRANDAHRAHDVQLIHRKKILVRRVRKRLLLCRPRAIDDRIDRAETIFGETDQPPRLACVPKIGAQRMGVRQFGAQRVDCGFVLMILQRAGVSRGGEFAGAGASDAAACAEDQHGPVGTIHGFSPNPFLLYMAIIRQRIKNGKQLLLLPVFILVQRIEMTVVVFKDVGVFVIRQHRVMGRVGRCRHVRRAATCAW